MEHLLNNLNHVAKYDAKGFSCFYANYLVMPYLTRFINYA